MVMVKVVGVAVLPWLSVALQVTVVVPMAKVEPETGEHVAVPVPSTASEVVGLEYKTFAPDALVASRVIFEWLAITGAVVSCTVMVKLPFAVLLCESVAEQLTVVVLMAKVLPEAGEQLTGRLPSTTSVADAE